MSRVRVDSRHTYSVHWTAPFCVPWGRRGGTKPHAGRREGVVRTTTARETGDLRLSVTPPPQRRVDEDPNCSQLPSTSGAGTAAGCLSDTTYSRRSTNGPC